MDRNVDIDDDGDGPTIDADILSRIELAMTPSRKSKWDSAGDPSPISGPRLAPALTESSKVDDLLEKGAGRDRSSRSSFNEVIDNSPSSRTNTSDAIAKKKFERVIPSQNPQSASKGGPTSPPTIPANHDVDSEGISISVPPTPCGSRTENSPIYLLSDHENSDSAPVEGSNTMLISDDQLNSDSAVDGSSDRLAEVDMSIYPSLHEGMHQTEDERLHYPAGDDDNESIDDIASSSTKSDDGTTTGLMQSVEFREDATPEGATHQSFSSGAEVQEVDDDGISADGRGSDVGLPHGLISGLANLTSSLSSRNHVDAPQAMLGTAAEMDGVEEDRPNCDISRRIHILRCGHPVLALDSVETQPCANNCVGSRGQADVQEELGCHLCYRLRRGTVEIWYLRRLDHLLLPKNIPKDESEHMKRYRKTEIIFLKKHGVIFPRAVRRPRAREEPETLEDLNRHQERCFSAVGAEIMHVNTLANIHNVQKAITTASDMESQHHRQIIKEYRRRRPCFDVDVKKGLLKQLESHCHDLEQEVAPKVLPGWGATSTASILFRLVECGEKLPHCMPGVVMVCCIKMGFFRFLIDGRDVSTDRICELTGCSIEDVTATMEPLQEVLSQRAVNSAGHIPRSLSRTSEQRGVLEWLWAGGTVLI